MALAGLIGTTTPRVACCRRRRSPRPTAILTGLAWHERRAVTAATPRIHPGWEDDVSPTHGYIFKIDFVEVEGLAAIAIGYRPSAFSLVGRQSWELMAA